jgi:integrase
MSIKKVTRDDGVRYQVYGRRDGKKVYVSTHTSRREAIEADEDFRTTQRKIERGELAPEHDSKRTYGAAAKLWLESLAASGARSHEEYEQRNELYLLPMFKDVPITEIRKSNVLAWRDDLVERMSAASVNSITGTLSAAFSWFVGRDWIEHNPCAGVKRLKQDSRVFPWIDSPEAITRLLGECPVSVRSIAAVLVGTGMRLDEALHLHWDDIDLEHRLITVHRGRKGQRPTGTTKSGKARRVPIFDSVMPVLKAMKLARGPSAVLWPSTARIRLGRKPPPDRPMSQSSVRKPFKDAVTRAGLPKELRLHDLRHTFASLFLVDGGDIFKLSRILGHHSVVITERTYAHLKPSAFEEDYGRVRFAMPSEGKVIAIR